MTFQNLVVPFRTIWKLFRPYRLLNDYDILISSDNSGYRQGASYLTVQYRQGASYLTVLYRQGVSYLTVLYRQLITTFYYSNLKNFLR